MVNVSVVKFIKRCFVSMFPREYSKISRFLFMNGNCTTPYIITGRMVYNNINFLSLTIKGRDNKN